MIKSVHQTEYQELEARAPDSLARQMLASLIRREREAHRELRTELASRLSIPYRLDVTRARWLEARRAAETARRILYGIEQ